jgi:RNA polymerase sigma-70 factor (ECF subfamily)
LRIDLRGGKRGLKSQHKLDDEVGVCLRDGDIEGAAARVIQGCGACIRGYLRVALGEDRQVRDAFSAFSEAVWQRIRRYRAEKRLVVWAHRLAYVAAKERRETSRLRKPSSTRKAKPGSRDLSRTRAATLEPLGAAEDAELMRRELSLEEQTLLTLRIDRQFEWAEIAWVLSQGSGSDVGAQMARRFERLVARLHATAVARGLIERGPMPANLASLQLSRRSSTRDG